MTIKALYPTVQPTLNLDFAKTKALDPRVTFSRSSTATFVGSDRLIQTAASDAARFDHNPATGESLGLLVEEARTNIIVNSPVFNTGGWVLDGVSLIANAAIAPNGTMTATSIVQGTGNNRAYHFDNSGVLGSKVFSIFAKANAGTSLEIRAVGNMSPNTTATVNLSSGTVSGFTGATVQSYPNGWYRVLLPVTVSIASGSSTYWWITGPASSVLIWGAQLEAGSFPTSYIPTPATFASRASSATYYDANGVIQTAGTNVARSAAFFPDSNGVMRPAGLLLEAAGTNLLNGSQTFATAGGTQNDWVDANITRDGTLRTSPDGTANALRVTAAAADATIISSAAIGTSAQRTFSIFLRRVTGTGNIQYTLDNGTTWTTQAITSSWVRYSFPVTTANQQVGIRITTSGDAIELWGAQLEASPYPTSYIATTTATVTRSADVSSSATVTRSADVASITGTNFSSWYNSSEGSMFVSGSTNPTTTTSYLVHFYGASGTQNRIALLRNTFGIGVLVSETNAVTQAVIALASGASIATPSKLAGAYKLNDYYLAQSSITGTDTSGTPDPSINKLSIGSQTAGATAFANGTISRLTYWPTRLSDATLQAITL